MIKIEVRQNETFELGFPYNSSVDDYFKLLSEDFIKNYGLDDDSVLEINDHKNRTLQFDRDLHEFILKLSAFIVGFETTGKVIVDEFDELVSARDELQAQLDTMGSDQLSADNEYEFVLSNIENLQTNIEKINSFLDYYNGQIIDDTYSYNDDYISDTETKLELLGDIIINNESDFEYYHDSLYSHIDEMVLVKETVFDRNFVETSLRTIYEEWQKRPEQHYQDLVAHFEEEYNRYWTYGSSLMYGETVDDETDSTIIYDSIAERWQQTLFKRYSFTIEKEIKEYSLQWLTDHQEFDNREFMYVVESKKVSILNREITDLEQVVIDKKQVVRVLLPYEKEQNYLKYRELVLARRKYKYDNLNGVVDQTIIDNYDSMLADLLNDYNYTTSKYSQKDYWRYNSDWEMHNELLTELRRQLDKSERAIIREFKRDTPNNEEFLAKISFYTEEKDKMTENLNELISMKEKKEIENNINGDQISLLRSRLYEKESLVEQKRNQYLLFFDERIPFFTQNITSSEVEGIVELLGGNYLRDFQDQYVVFDDYICGVEWYDREDRENLKKHYTKMIGIIEKYMKEEWHREFTHDILDPKKLDIYGYYLDRETRLLYGMVNKHLLNNTYDNDSIYDINRQKQLVKDIFVTYLEIAFNIKENISVITSLFDYGETLEFTISDDNETIENITETFYEILDDITTFAYNKNIEFKVFETNVDEMEKINQVWLDMEKKYV